METSKSPWTVMREAFDLASGIWPAYSHQFSRHDFTLPALFACLVVREMLRLSYRKTEALLRDTPQWLAAVGLSRAPDHNTLWHAFGILIQTHRVQRMLDLMAHLDQQARRLVQSNKPLSLDSTCYEHRYRSRHYERVCRKMALDEGGKYARKVTPRQVNRSRSRHARTIPKLALAVNTASHAILAAVAHTGNGSDAPDFEPLLYHAWRRWDVKVVVADGGYDSENNHRLARLDMNVRSIIPPKIGKPTGRAPLTRFRKLMYRRFARKADGQWYAQRSQSETVNSMMKRNFGDALRSINRKRREQEMLLRALTHDLMLRAAQTGA